MPLQKNTAKPFFMGGAVLEAWTRSLAHPPIREATIQPAAIAATIQIKMNGRGFKISNVSRIATPLH